MNKAKLCSFDWKLMGRSSWSDPLIVRLRVCMRKVEWKFQTLVLWHKFGLKAQIWKYKLIAFLIHIKKSIHLLGLIWYLWSYSRKTNNLGEFWGCDWSLTEHMEAPESRREHGFGESSIIITVIRRDWIFTWLLNAPEIRWNTIFYFLPTSQIQIVFLEYFLKCTYSSILLFLV